MRALRLSKKFSELFSSSSSKSSYRTLNTFYFSTSSSPSSSCRPSSNSLASPAPNNSITGLSSFGGVSPIGKLFGSPWYAIQHRGMKVSGSDVKVGNIIEKQGRIFEVIKVDHSHEGRGKATMKVELRDVNSGNKVTQRLATNEIIERVFVEEKTFIYMCTDRDGTIVLMDADTLDQLEVSKDLFGKNSVYLKDEMKVKVQLFDEKPLSASVPKRVTCIVKDAQPQMKGIGATPRNKKVVLDNGLSVEVPPHIVAGDAIVINTADDSYMERAKA